MTTIRKFARGILLLTAVLTLAACGPSVEPEPTPDADMIRTAAVMTVEAELTQQALMNPTPTQTNTPEPTATSDIPTLMPLSLETQTTDAGAALPGQAGATQAAPPPAAGAPDKAEWISNSPTDGSVLQPGQKFEIKWVVKNSGTTTWTTDYTVRFFSGNIPTDKSLYNLRAETKPGGTVEIIVSATAPTAAGDYYTWWKITNDQFANFGDIDLSIKVGGTAAPTATTAPEE
jgi:hypothetical protein